MECHFSGAIFTSPQDSDAQTAPSRQKSTSVRSSRSWMARSASQDIKQCFSLLDQLGRSLCLHTLRYSLVHISHSLLLPLCNTRGVEANVASIPIPKAPVLLAPFYLDPNPPRGASPGSWTMPLNLDQCLLGGETPKFNLRQAETTNSAGREADVLLAHNEHLITLFPASPARLSCTASFSRKV